MLTRLVSLCALQDVIINLKGHSAGLFLIEERFSASDWEKDDWEMKQTMERKPGPESLEL